MIDSQRSTSRVVGYNYLISNKRECNNNFIKNVQMIAKFELPGDLADAFTYHIFSLGNKTEQNNHYEKTKQKSVSGTFSNSDLSNCATRLKMFQFSPTRTE